MNQIQTIGISGGILFLLIFLFTIIAILIPTIKEQREWEKANKEVHKCDV